MKKKIISLHFLNENKIVETMYYSFNKKSKSKSKIGISEKIIEILFFGHIEQP